MSSLSRRRALALTGTALLGGGSGCLDARGAPARSVDLVFVNHTETDRSVDVRVWTADGLERIHRTFRIGSGELYAESEVLAGTRVRVSATLVGNPLYEVERSFDLRGCDGVRIVVAVRAGPEIYVGRRRGSC